MLFYFLFICSFRGLLRDPRNPCNDFLDIPSTRGFNALTTRMIDTNPPTQKDPAEKERKRKRKSPAR